jgi:hypothetical protein
MQSRVFWGDSIYQALGGSPTRLRPDKRAQSLIGSAGYQEADLPNPEVFTSEGTGHFFLVAGAYVVRVRDHNGSTVIDLSAAKATKVYLRGGNWYATPEVTYYVGSASSDSSEFTEYDITLDQPEYYQVRMRGLCNDLGYDGVDPVICTVTVAAGTEIGQQQGTQAAFRTGTFPSGSILTLINYGKISGYGGTAGTGAIAPATTATAGSAGGTAFKATEDISVDNQGTLRGGGGGGGGGGTDGTDDGGDGGGGQGQPGGLSPAGVAYRGTIGVSGLGTVAAGGAGDGGAGGAWGTAGTAGEDIVHPYGDGGAGGAAGYSVDGTSFVTWINTGTRTGPIV